MGRAFTFAQNRSHGNTTPTAPTNCHRAGRALLIKLPDTARLYSDCLASRLLTDNARKFATLIKNANF